MLNNILISQSGSKTLSNFPTSGLVGAYRFEEASGNLLTQVGTYNGTVNGTPTRQVIGKNNYCYYLEGTSSSINLGTSAYRFTQDFSISCWMKIPVGFNTSGGGQVITRYNASGGRCWTVSWIPSLRAFQSAVYNSSQQLTYVRSATNSVPIDVWFNYIVVKSGTTSTIWLNGVNIQSNAAMHLAIANVTTVNTYIGAVDKSNTSPDLWGQEYIDELYLWDRALTNSEVAALYNNGSGIFY